MFKLHVAQRQACHLSAACWLRTLSVALTGGRKRSSRQAGAGLHFFVILSCFACAWRCRRCGAASRRTAGGRIKNIRRARGRGRRCVHGPRGRPVRASGPPGPSCNENRKAGRLAPAFGAGRRSSVASESRILPARLSQKPWR
jgi:hypothetical protein